MLYRAHASQLFHSQSFLFQKSCVVRFHELKHFCRLRQKGAQTILFAKILLERKHRIVSKNRGKNTKMDGENNGNPIKIPWIWGAHPYFWFNTHMNVEKTETAWRSFYESVFPLWLPPWSHLTRNLFQLQNLPLNFPTPLKMKNWKLKIIPM